MFRAPTKKALDPKERQRVKEAVVAIETQQSDIREWEEEDCRDHGFCTPPKEVSGNEYGTKGFGLSY